MGGYYNVYSLEGKRTFHYRFTCGNCRRTVPWNDYSIKAEHSIRTKNALSPQIEQQLKDGLTKKLDAHIASIKKDTAAGFYFSHPFNSRNQYTLSDECLYCKQSSRAKGGIFQACVIMGIIGFFLGMIGSIVLLCFYIFESFPPVIMVTLGTMAACVAYGAITEANRERKLPVHTHVEYDWSGHYPLNNTLPRNSDNNEVDASAISGQSE